MRNQLVRLPDSPLSYDDLLIYRLRHESLTDMCVRNLGFFVLRLIYNGQYAPWARSTYLSFSDISHTAK